MNHYEWSWLELWLYVNGVMVTIALLHGHPDYHRSKVRSLLIWFWPIVISIGLVLWAADWFRK
jgi:hypothetical protein